MNIPASIRKKYGLKDGQPLVIIEQGGRIVLIPIIDFESERKNFVTKEEMKKILENVKEEELQLENTLKF